MLLLSCAIFGGAYIFLDQFTQGVSESNNNQNPCYSFETPR